jgi:hypothetical protein
MESSERETFTVVYPFKWLHVPEKYDISAKGPYRPETVRAVSDEKGNAYLEIEGVYPEAAAKHMVWRCWFGLLCYSAMTYRPHDAELGIGEIRWLDTGVFEKDGVEEHVPMDMDVMRGIYKQTLGLDLADVDGFVTGHIPHYFPTGKKVKMTRQVLTFTLKQPSGDEVAEGLIKSVCDDRYYDHIDDKKLIAALQMVNLTRTNEHQLAQFVLIVSALEALMPDAVVSDETLKQIDRWEEEAKEKGIEELSNLTSLRKPNIALRFRMLADMYPPAWEAPNDVGQYQKQIKLAYRLRSELVHSGSCDEDKMTRVYPIVAELLHRVLTDRLRWQPYTRIPQEKSSSSEPEPKE